MTASLHVIQNAAAPSRGRSQKARRQEFKFDYAGRGAKRTSNEMAAALLRLSWTS